jgi:hypothetical protein
MNRFNLLLALSCAAAVVGGSICGCGAGVVDAPDDAAMVDSVADAVDDLPGTDVNDAVEPRDVIESGFDADDSIDVGDSGDVADLTDAADVADVADASDIADVPFVQLCNGKAELCARRLDEVAFVTTHNAMAYTPDFAFYNQTHDIAKQLAMGVRGFMLDTHYVVDEDPSSDATVLLCHGPCVFGQRPLSDTLTDIRVFLDENPGEIVAIIFESYVSAAHTKVSFELADVVDMCLEPQAGQPLPTLQEMVDQNRRLVVLTDRDGGAYPWYLNVWEWAWDNDWDNKVPDDLNCDVNRGQDTNPLFIMNHFLTNPVASVELAQQINVNPFCNDQAFKCQAERSHRPNFVTVDFFEIGDVFAVVDALNQSDLP